VRQALEHDGLVFFDNLRTGPGLLAWLREAPVSAMPWPHPVALAACAGDPAYAQRLLDKVIADSQSTSDWYGRWLLRKAALIAARLGLDCPAPADTPVLSAVFRVAVETPPRERHRAFHELEDKYAKYAEHLRTLLPAEQADQLYQTAECTSDSCTIAFYGVDDETMLHRLRQSFDKSMRRLTTELRRQ
jgi:hypothetical protein